MLTLNGETFLTTTEAADMLGVTPGHLRNCRSERRGPGLVPFVLVGRSVVYREAAVLLEVARRKALSRANAA